MRCDSMRLATKLTGQENIQTDVPQAVANNPQASFEQCLPPHIVLMPQLTTQSLLPSITNSRAGSSGGCLELHRVSNDKRSRLLIAGFLDAFVHDMKCARFVLLMSFLEHNLASGGVEGTARDECLVASMEVCKTALPFLSAGLQPQYMGAQK